ncbi:MAG: 2,3-bisphosphoglycerate-independent phosphoglycerate mutase [Armatimonadetes bacterium]|jgi:2,3-bisphosphoglycerate-independent phosphoglycerate mutase|nr:2,3-bisphosphoglycerate-independent phosphoglycerate mutase [Armatimonadota bacterium]
MAAHSDTYPALLLIGDGLGDRAVPELGGKTPLEAANTPTLDRLAAECESGLMDPIGAGIRGGSDTGHLAILGYDPYKYYPGRGPFEALGIGMDVQRGDLAFRCNFSTVDADLTVLDRRAGRINEGTTELAAAVNGLQIEDVTCFFKESIAHRAALVLRGPGLGHQVTDVDPHADGVRVWEARAENPGDEASAKTARILNEFVRKSYELMDGLPVNQRRREQGLPPANIALPRGIGVSPDLPPFNKRWNVKSACIVEVGLVKGLGNYLGMDVIDVEGSTAGLDTDTEAMGNAVIAALKDHDFILCNVKGPDIAGHDRNAQGKVAIIEKIDTMIQQILDAVDGKLILMFSGDHSTPVTYGDHTGEPCPVLFWGPTVRTDTVTSFGETAASAGGVGRIRGLDVVPILTSYMGVQEKFGA